MNSPAGHPFTDVPGVLCDSSRPPVAIFGGSTAFHPLFTTTGGKLKLLQTRDPFKQWWSLDEARFCAKCQHLFLGRDIRFLQDDREVIHFLCPTHGCDASFEHWQYPRLHL